MAENNRWIIILIILLLILVGWQFFIKEKKEKIEISNLYPEFVGIEGDKGKFPTSNVFSIARGLTSITCLDSNECKSKCPPADSFCQDHAYCQKIPNWKSSCVYGGIRGMIWNANVVNNGDTDIESKILSATDVPIGTDTNIGYFDDFFDFTQKLIIPEKTSKTFVSTEMPIVNYEQYEKFIINFTIKIEGKDLYYNQILGNRLASYYLIFFKDEIGDFYVAFSEQIPTFGAQQMTIPLYKGFTIRRDATDQLNNIYTREDILKLGVPSCSPTTCLSIYFTPIYAFDISNIPNDAIIDELQFWFYVDEGMTLRQETFRLLDSNINIDGLYPISYQNDLKYIETQLSGYPIKILHDSDIDNTFYLALNNNWVGYDFYYALGEHIAKNDLISLIKGQNKLIIGFYSPRTAYGEKVLIDMLNNKPYLYIEYHT